MRSMFRLVSYLRKNSKLSYFPSNFRYFSNQGSLSSKVRVDDLYINSDVQRILKKITGRDYDRIFAPKPTRKIEPHQYIFATDEKLKKLQQKADLKASAKLQMPPVMAVREPINEVLSKDPELQGLTDSKLVFIDISPDVHSRERIITVRETDGTLRKASWEERHRMDQIFFPRPARHLDIPPLFFSPDLDRLLAEGSYRFVLDYACSQFEPDDPEYHRVTHTTYDHVNKMKKFDDLRSTRHFGPMAFYFAYNKNIDGLLIDMIERELISDAADTIKLLYIMNPDLQSHTKSETDEIKVIQEYIKNYSKETSNLELRLQTYFELQQQSQTMEEQKEATA